MRLILMTRDVAPRFFACKVNFEPQHDLLARADHVHEVQVIVTMG